MYILLAYMSFFCQSSTPVELSEAETEYAVNVVKHIYDGHVVFQYNCTNTIPEQLLENVIGYVSICWSFCILLKCFGTSLAFSLFLLRCQVTVFVYASEAEDFSEVASKPLRSLPYDSPGQTFVAFEKPYGLPATGRFSNLLKFFVKEVWSFWWFDLLSFDLSSCLSRVWYWV